MMKSNKVLLTFLSLTAICATAACSRAPGPDDVLNTYLTDWSKQDYQGMYQLLSDSAKQSITEKVFVQRYQAITSGIGTTAIQIKDRPSGTAKPSGNTISLNFAVTWKTNMTRPFTEKYHVKLVNGKNGWQIDWQPNLIFPQLKPGWQVHASVSEPTRGSIITADGKPLAENVAGQQIGLVPGKMNKQSAAAVASVLKLSTQDVESKLHQSWVKPDLFVPIETLPSFQEQTIQKQLLAIPGVLITPSSNPVRTYPMGRAAAHVVGYVGADHGTVINGKTDTAGIQCNRQHWPTGAGASI